MKIPHLAPIDFSTQYQPRENNFLVGDWIRRCTEEPDSGKKIRIGILGSPDDMGVIKNMGRPGAQQGPASIRKALYQMALPPWMESHLEIMDYGNIIPAPTLVETHKRTQVAAQEIVKQTHLFIHFGGGHDFAAPTFLAGLGAHGPGASIVNVDPHFDLRAYTSPSPQNQHSGTPFRFLIESGSLLAQNYFAFGVRENRNDRSVWHYVRDQGIAHLELETLLEGQRSVSEAYHTFLTQAESQSPWIHATFDIDACQDVPGSSAAPVVGFTSWQMIQMARLSGNLSKVKTFEICEVAPSLDPQGMTSKLAAEMTYAFLKAKSLIQTL